MTTVQQLYSLEGQTALVTGGTRGIGQSMAIALAEAGADILLVQVLVLNTTSPSALLTIRFLAR
jgi:2-deoxy-D-gluconate 3-dehydrogenase